MTRFADITDIKMLNRSAGYHYFDADTMRFFKSRATDPIYPCADGSAFFVTSEDYAWQGTRRYFVHHATTDGKISSVREVEQPENGYATSRTARNIASTLASKATTSGEKHS